MTRCGDRADGKNYDEPQKPCPPTFATRRTGETPAPTLALRGSGLLCYNDLAGFGRVGAEGVTEVRQLLKKLRVTEICVYSLCRTGGVHMTAPVV